MVPKGTLFEGGNDNNGKKRLYASDFDAIVNKSEIDQVKTVTIDGSDSEEAKSIVQDDILKDGTPHPFELGFAISSPVLYLKDGARTAKILPHNIDSRFNIEIMNNKFTPKIK